MLRLSGVTKIDIGCAALRHSHSEVCMSTATIAVFSALIFGSSHSAPMRPMSDIALDTFCRRGIIGTIKYPLGVLEMGFSCRKLRSINANPRNLIRLIPA
jgi:hypothetical protein